MDSPELVETRRISGKGVLRVPAGNTNSRYYLLYVDVIRDAINPYRNYYWQPYRSRYCTLVFLRNGYVQSYQAVEFAQQEFLFIADITGQSLIAQKCALDANNQSIINLGLSLSRPPISVDNPIKDYATLQLTWDEIRVVCYADTAVELRLYVQKYDTCKPEYDIQDGGGEPPPPVPKIPAGQPSLDISPPYDPTTSDDGATQKYSKDEYPSAPPPLPGAENGVMYNVTFEFDVYNSYGQLNSHGTFNATVRGAIKDYGLSDDLRTIDGRSDAVGGYVIGTNVDGSSQVFVRGYGYVGGFTAKNLTNLSITKTS